jgi:hypothetical protein
MTEKEREQLLALNESLCREYNETDDPLVLEQIGVTEMLLFHDYDRLLAQRSESRTGEANDRRVRESRRDTGTVENFTEHIGRKTK